MSVYLIHGICAKQITLSHTLRVAQEVTNSKSGLRISNSDFKWVYSSYRNETDLRSSSSEKNRLYDVYNKGNNNGFIIIAADDVAYPVIGYTNEGNYEDGALPPNFKNWMEGVEKTIGRAIENQLLPSESVREAWNAYLSGQTAKLRSFSATGPLVQSKWNQTAPYNDLCPVYSGNSKSTTGCVATTMAQILQYYRHPASGIRNTDSYITTTHGLPIPSLDLSHQTYNWNIMYNTTGDLLASPEAQAEVAKLMYHCAVGIYTDFGFDSGAYLYDAADALVYYFGYDASMRQLYRGYYNYEEWTKLIIDELNVNRIIFYSGTNAQSGHSFVCDGSDDTGLFHFNWGWGGLADGYYAIDALNSGNAGTPGGNGTYNEGQEMIINIKPNVGGQPAFDIVMGPDNGISSATPITKQNSVFEVEASFWNIGYGTFDGFLGIILTDLNGQFIESISPPVGAVSIDYTYGYFEEMIPCKISANVPDGDYLIKAAIMPWGTSAWIPISADAYKGHARQLLIKVDHAADIQTVVRENSIYFSGNQLYVNTPVAEKISLYSAAGELLYQTQKPMGRKTLSIDKIQNQVLLIKGSSGWAKKLILK
ncbi:hypothetical protein FACS1894160_2980 [Bacteroidia bacterium]|nr:hypothetical protein FACS1894160_2980 [Bacteroidia bacterium]